MFERFRPGARRVVELAQDRARTLGHNYIGTEHLLLGLISEREGTAARVLASVGIKEEDVRTDIVELIGLGGPDPNALAAVGIDLDQVRHHAEEAFGPGALQRTMAGCRGGLVGFTPRSKRVLELALREARTLGHRYLDTEHVLLGLLRQGEGVAVEILTRTGLPPDRRRNALIDRIQRDIAS